MEYFNFIIIIDSFINHYPLLHRLSLLSNSAEGPIIDLSNILSFLYHFFRPKFFKKFQKPQVFQKKLGLTFFKKSKPRVFQKKFRSLEFFKKICQVKRFFKNFLGLELFKKNFTNLGLLKNFTGLGLSKKVFESFDILIK